MAQVKRQLAAKQERENCPTVLSISPIEADQVQLEDLISQAEWPSGANLQWTLLKRSAVTSALPVLLGNSEISIVICDSDALPLGWRELMELFESMADPPLLIVTTSLVEDRFWGMIRSGGAFEVLAKPLNRKEVMRALSSAWLQRRGAAEVKFFKAGSAVG